MSSQDPIRWVDAAGNAPPELRAMLGAAKEVEPSRQQIAAVATKLGPALAGAGTIALLKPLLVVGALALGGGVATLAVTNQPRDRAPTVQVVQKAQAPVALPSVRSVNSVAETAQLAPESSVSNDTPPAAADPRTSPQEAPTRTAAAPKPSEVSLLQAAQSALSSDPRKALALTERHRALYPSGALTQEREVLAIDAMKRLGSLEAARARADRFDQAYPHSAHRHKIDRTLDDSATK